jgi:hypothetical protein
MNPSWTPVFLFLSIGSVALFSFIGVAAWVDARRREREAYYRSETLKRIAGADASGAQAALEHLHEQERYQAQNVRERNKRAGLVVAAIGLGLLPLLRAVAPNEPVYLAALIPLLIGFALLVYAYLLAPRL